ncbi:hypothetical protein ABFS83_07G073300 [Erythranthe nasuta]
MKMEGEIISRENIKPCSATPLSKRIHSLSLLDQIVAPFHVPLVLYYPNQIVDESTTQILKHSLSTILSLFYPFAGRILDALTIDCNDEGALFIVAKFNENLSDFLKSPDPEACGAHIPGQITMSEPSPGSHVAMIQVNYFGCGGIAIGTLLSHKIADAATYCTFMKAWAAATRDSSGKPPLNLIPNYTAHSLFPKIESMAIEDNLAYHVVKRFKMGRTVMRRYVFDARAISKIRAQLSCSPSRVQCVTALLFKCYMVASNKFATQAGSDTSKSYVTHVVNMRRKVDPPFPESSVGNFIWPATALTVNNQAHRDLKYVFGEVQSAITNVDADLVYRMQGDEGFPGYRENLKEALNQIPEDANGLTIISWCNFGVYDTDFGWGKPTWVTKCDGGNDSTDAPFYDGIWLTDTRHGDGIEACLVMDQRFFAEFDKIQELTDLASIDPSPLDIGKI